MKIKKFFLLIVFSLLNNFVFSQKEIKVLNIRWSDDREKIRIVFDLEKIPSYTVYFQQNPARVFLETSCLKFSENIKLPFVISNKPVKDITYQQIILDSFNYSRIVINLHYYVPFEYFNLENPARIVFDFKKIFEIRYIYYPEDGIRVEEIKKGVVSGPLSINILKIYLTNKNIELLPALSGKNFREMKTLSEIVAEKKAFAGINGGYFAKGGQPLSLLCISGKIITENIMQRTCLGITEDKEVVIDSLIFKGKIITAKGENFVINGVNRERRKGEIILYTSEFGTTTGTNATGKEFIIVEDTVVEIRDGNSSIPENGLVISADRDVSDILYANISIGEKIILDLRIETQDGKRIVNALGGGPRLLKGGNIFITSEAENFKPDITSLRAPRTAVGLTRYGELFITVVDGRQPDLSIGMTLEELAEFLFKEGVVDALNLDGGGSSTMVVNGKLLNSPSDGKERKISSALLIFLNKEKVR